MNKDLEDKVIRFIRTMAEDGNWEVIDGYPHENQLHWTKESYDPQYVAQELLDLIENE